MNRKDRIRAAEAKRRYRLEQPAHDRKQRREAASYTQQAKLAYFQPGFCYSPRSAEG